MEQQAVEVTQSVDWKLVAAILALLISFGTFLFNAYYQILRKPKLTAAFGDIFTLGYASNNELLFHRPITFFNDGAKYAAIISIRGVIHDVANIDECAKFRWRSFIESSNIGEKGKEFKPWWGFKSWVSTIIIGGHSAENVNIGFKTETSFELMPGKYSVKYLFYGHQGVLGSAQETFTVSEENCIFLHEKCTVGENRVRESTLVLTKDLLENG